MTEAKKRKLDQTEINRISLVKDKHDECFPIKYVEDLKNWNPPMLHHVTAPLRERVPTGNYPKTLVCHDMKGGYLEDRFINGSNTEDNFYFLHWTVIDIFVYFSHHLVTIPPCGWISSAHKNGVQILGTFITEWEDGVKVCEEFFKDEETVEQLCTQLVKIADYYNFDGWLINIENKLQVCQIPLLEKFVRVLTEKMHLCKHSSQVIWYDSVLETGDLKWQNALNEKNRIFFNCCDGIFLNYNWTEDTLQQSVNVAGERTADVFVGVDVFGRGCPGGGGFCTNIAVTAARKFNLSVAIFAPGWIHECLATKDFKENQFKFWDALQKLCPPRAVKSLPYSSSFCPGFGKQLFKNGKAFSHEPWFNISLQQPQPIYYSDHCSDETSISVYNEDAFSGGGCICLTGNANKEAKIMFQTVGLKEILCFKILKTSFTLEENVILSYTFKPLSPNLEVALVLHVINSQQNYDLHLVGKKYDISDSVSSYILPASKDEIKGSRYEMNENPAMILDWTKRAYVLKSSNFSNHIIEGISVIVTALQNEASCVLLGELEILPFRPRIKFTYKNLVCEYDNNKNVTVRCTLQWSYHPSIHYSDLFSVSGKKKEHICRTSQFYYNLEFSTEVASDLEILLSFQSCGHDCFSDASLKIPVALI